MDRVAQEFTGPDPPHVVPALASRHGNVDAFADSVCLPFWVTERRGLGLGFLAVQRLKKRSRTRKRAPRRTLYLALRATAPPSSSSKYLERNASFSRNPRNRAAKFVKNSVRVWGSRTNDHDDPDHTRTNSTHPAIVARVRVGVSYPLPPDVEVFRLNSARDRRGNPAERRGSVRLWRWAGRGCGRGLHGEGVQVEVRGGHAQPEGSAPDWQTTGSFARSASF